MTTICVATNGAKTGLGNARFPMSSIPAAVRQAVPGDTIDIRAGTYPSFTLEHLHGRYRQPITIQGEPGAKVVIDAHQPGGEEYYVVHCSQDGSWFKLRNLTITTSDPLVAESRAIDITTPDGLAEWMEIRDELTLRRRDGIKFNRSGTGSFRHVTVENCHIHDLPSYGIQGQLHLGRIQRNHIEHCGYPGEGYGMYMEQSTGLAIVDNTIHGNTGWGLTLAQMHRCYVADNRIYDIRSPYVHHDSGRVALESSSGGISIWRGGSANRIVRNHVWGCHWGAKIDAGEIAATVQGNHIFCCHTGIYRAPGTDVRLRQNHFWGNGLDIQTP